MTSRRSMPFIIICLGAAMVTAAAGAGGVDECTITLKDIVAEVVPCRGAGHLEEPGSTDVYTLSVPAGTGVFFDELSGGCSIRWECRDADRALVFSDTLMCVGDPGVVELALGGDYTITVFGAGDATGMYSFTVWEVNPVDFFVVGLEEEAAGEIEEPGSIDIFTLAVDAGTEVFFDELSGGCSVRWTCHAPDESLVFSEGACPNPPTACPWDLDESGDVGFTDLLQVLSQWGCR